MDSYGTSEGIIDSEGDGSNFRKANEVRNVQRENHGEERYWKQPKDVEAQGE